MSGTPTAAPIRLILNSEALPLAERLTHHLAARGERALMFQVSLEAPGRVSLLDAPKRFEERGLGMHLVQPEHVPFALDVAEQIRPSVLVLVAKPGEVFSFPAQGAVRVQLNLEGRVPAALVKELVEVLGWARQQDRRLIWAEVLAEDEADPGVFPG